MIIDTEQIRELLEDKSIPAYSIEVKTGVSRHTITKFRREDVDFEKFQLKTLIKLQNYLTKCT